MSPVALPTGVPGTPLIKMYTYVFVLLYRPSAFGGKAPESWSVLTDPRFKGRIGLGAPGNGEIAIAPIAGGGSAATFEADIEKGWAFLRRVKANAPLVGKGEDITRWLQQAEVDLGVAILTDAVDMKKKGIDVGWAVPKEGSYFANDCMWVPKGSTAAETYWAKQYINFAMSEGPHKAWTSGLGLPGTRKGLTVPAEFKGDPAYPTTPEDFAKLFTIDPMVKVRNWGTWHTRYKEILGI
jgi:putative spermidine/putrescine transport system substrate-binding protein